MCIGWPEKFPDYETQGKLKENLKDGSAEISGGRVPQVFRVGELRVA